MTTRRLLRRNSSSGHGKMLDQADIEAAVAEVARAAAAEGVRVALAGGVALQRYGSRRFTADVDFVADRAVSIIRPETRLTFGGYGGHTAQGVPVDLIMRSDGYADLYAEALQHARRDTDGVLVIPAEYLAAMKLVARRDKDDVDLETLVVGRMFDVKKAARIIKRLLGLYAADDFVSIVKVTRWKNRMR